MSGSAVEAKARKLVTLSVALRTYIKNNEDALIDYGRQAARRGLLINTRPARPGVPSDRGPTPRPGTRS